MTFLDLFRRESRQALLATPSRKFVSLGVSSAILVAWILFNSTVEWWIWILLVIADLLLFAALGSYWAGVDEVERAENMDP